MYSYGIILWEILSRRIPFSSLSGQRALISFVIQGKREPIPENSPKVLASLTAECWAQEPEQRPTMVQVVQSLKESPVIEEMAAAPVKAVKMMNSVSGSSVYGVDSGLGRGYGSPVSRGRGLPQTPPSGLSGSSGNAYVLDSSPQQTRGRGLPPAPGGRSGGGFFAPVQPASGRGLGGAYSVDSSYGSLVSRGRGLPQTPPSGLSGSSGNAYVLDSSPQQARGRGLPPTPGGRSGRGFFAPVQQELIGLQGGENAYSLDSAKPSAVRGRGASLQNSGYGQGGYG